MKDMKPVAWLCEASDGENVYAAVNEFQMKEFERFGRKITPLYAIPKGCVVAPVEPTENQWSGLARHLMMWLDLTDRPTGEKLYSHLDMLGIDPPAWLLEEIPNTNTVPSKGTRVAVIYKAMLKAAQEEG